MKRVILSVLVLLLYTATANAQAAKITWGEEFKGTKESYNVMLIYADNTCSFVKESHDVDNPAFEKNHVSKESITLMKFDASMQKLLEKSYDKELENKLYVTFFFLNGKAFLLASVYDKNTFISTLLAVEIDKNSGELIGDWATLDTQTKDSKLGSVYYKAMYNHDSTKMVLASALFGVEESKYQIRLFGDKLMPLNQPIISIKDFHPRTFVLESLIYTTEGNVVLMGRQYKYQDGKRQVDDNLELDNYVIRIYSANGTIIKNINADSNAKWVVSAKIQQMPNKDLIFAAFYGDKTEPQQIKGLLIQRINPVTGEIITTHEKILHSYKRKISDGKNYVDKRTKEEKELEKKLKREWETYSKDMGIRYFIPTTDNGVVILAEKEYNFKFYSSYTSSGSNIAYSYGLQRYEYGDILMIKVNAVDSIDWMRLLPKDQQENGFSTDRRSFFGSYVSKGFFETGSNEPLYSGFGVLVSPAAIHIFFNDNGSNKDVLKIEQSVAKDNDRLASHCFVMKLDPITGEYMRSSLFKNRHVPTAMPRLGLAVDKTFHLLGYELKLLGKTKLVLAKINID